MIKKEILSEKDIGKYVKFTNLIGEDEIGRIKSYTDKWVYVVYKCDNDRNNYMNYTANATNYKYLSFIKNKND